MAYCWLHYSMFAVAECFSLEVVVDLAVDFLYINVLEM